MPHLEPGRPARPGQLILERRLRILKRILGSDGWGDLLDIGCGNGAQTLLFREYAAALTGVDIIHPRAMEAIAEDMLPRFVMAEAGALPFGDGSFDLVTAFEVLEHLPDERAAFGEARRVLRDGGWLFFTVPNRWWLFESHGGVVPGFNWIPWNRVPFLSWLPTRLHDAVSKARIYTLHRAASIAEESGFEVQEQGYITAPLDVLPPGKARRLLRNTFFRMDVTPVPFLAVNLYIAAQKR